MRYSQGWGLGMKSNILEVDWQIGAKILWNEECIHPFFLFIDFPIRSL
jgi:hypothetical protein